MSALTIVPDDQSTQVQVDARRLVGVRTALGHLRGGRPGRAYYELVRSVQDQARLAGVVLDAAPAACPCGGRCPKGGAGR